MNRLVIVGNGFDLAHGMKTGYNDFLLWYLKHVFDEAFNVGFYNDDAISVNKTNSHSVLGTLKTTSDYIDHFYNDDNLMSLVSSDEMIYDDLIGTHFHPFRVKIKTEFIRMLIQTCSIKRWVDIENEYYEALKKANSLVLNSDQVVLELNLSLTEIVKQLQAYLDSLPKPSNVNEYFDILRKNILSKDMVKSVRVPEIVADRTMILNFNYTPTIERYINDSGTSINYIHGKIGDLNNPLIFGFGDELDEEYKRFETSKVRGIFEYIKSFWYFRTLNYHHLIRFIQSADYQVTVLGHSCGLSDRTMLNMVFEDPNCKSVKIYHHSLPDGKDNYTEITHEIARHFKNKQEMRKKIVPFDKESYMPQLCEH